MNETLVNASKPIPVTMKDGTKDSVSLADLSIEEVFTFIEHLLGNKSVALVALSTRKPDDWVNSLSDQSFAELSKEAHALNFSRAVVISKGDAAMARMITPILASLVGTMNLANGAISGLDSPAPSPVPAPSESAGATGTG